MKSLVVYKLTKPSVVEDLHSADFNECRFTECMSQDTYKTGFSLTLDGTYVSLLSGMHVMKFTTQTKKPNKAEVAKRVKVLVDEYEQEFGVPCNKKQLAVFNDQVVSDLLPLTFADEPKHHTMFIHGDKLYVEGTYKQAEEATACLRKVLGSLPLVNIETSENVSETLTRFVGKSISDKLILKDKCVLETQEERKITVAKSLYHSEAQDIVEQGAVVKAVELEFDGIMKFTIKDDLSFTGIKFYDNLTEEVEKGDEAGTMIIQLHEVVNMFNEVLEEMGGEDYESKL